MRTRVKICGITRLEDALLAVELGADALGFIFYPPSPRALAPAAARAIIDRLPPYVTPVAVTVNETPDSLDALMTASGCQWVQLSGDEPPALLAQVRWPAMKAVAIASCDDLAKLDAYRDARAILLDTKKAGHYGGTGMAFDWTLAREATACGRPIVLAGGLGPENVAQAVATAAPYAVDVSSRVESAPGVKDPEKLRALFAALTAC